MSVLERIKKAVDEVHEEIVRMVELYDLEVLEVSAVDHPANLRDQWLMMKRREGADTMKRVTKTKDGQLTAQPTDAPAADGQPSGIESIAVTHPEAQRMAKAVGALLQAVLGGGGEHVEKKLTVNRDAKEAFLGLVSKIYREFENTISLLYSLDAEVGEGSLDEILAKQCDIMAQVFVYLRALFMGQEASPPEDITKRGRKMSSENLEHLVKLRDEITGVAERMVGFTKRFVEDAPAGDAGGDDPTSPDAGADTADVAKAVNQVLDTMLDPVRKQLEELRQGLAVVASGGGALPSGNALDPDAEQEQGPPRGTNFISQRSQRVYDFSRQRRA